jgi:hypothetical protein
VFTTNFRWIITFKLTLVIAMLVSACGVTINVEIDQSPTPTPDIPVTVMASVKATLTALPSPTAATTYTPTPTCTPTPMGTPTLPPTSTVALVSFHGRYVTAMNGDKDWVLRQELELGDCGQFTLVRLDDGQVAFVTCYNRYVTAPITGTEGLDWALRQEPKLSDCARFISHDLGYGKVALETCAYRYFTAATDGWAPELRWLIVAQTYRLDLWEMFVLQQQTAPVKPKSTP